MIRKEIQFTNFNDEKETGVFYFNMSKGELVMQQMSAIDQHTESFQDKLEKIAKNLQGKALVETLKEIIEDAYGEKTTDGKNFVKVRNGVKLVENFLSSGAYSELVVELCTNSELCAEFINGVVPAKLRAQVNSEIDNLTKAKTAQQIREESLAAKGGHNQKQESSVKQVPDLPIVIEQTAEPVFAPQPETQFPTPSPTPEVPVGLDDLAAFKAWQENQKQPAQQG